MKRRLRLLDKGESMAKSRVTTSQTARRVPAVPLVSPEDSAAKRGLISESLFDAAEGPIVDRERKRLMIAQAAYYCAEKRGFASGGELQDWFDGNPR
jgi:hypothetical protein